MGSRYEVEVTISSAKDLKNINWRHGKLRPYAVVWVDPQAKFSTRVNEEGDTFPYWDEKLVIPFNSPAEESTLHVDIVHANAVEDTKPLIGSAKLSLREVVYDVGYGSRLERKLELKRPSGRPHGKLEVSVTVREPRYRAPDPYYAPYKVPPAGSRDYSAAPPPYGNTYAAPPAPAYAAPQGPAYSAPSATAYSAPPSGYPYSAPSYGQPSYGQPAYDQGGNYGQPGFTAEAKKKNKFGGMGTGLAVGAVAGVLGGLALSEGVGALENHIADKVEDRVEDDGGYDDDDY